MSVATASDTVCLTSEERDKTVAGLELSKVSLTYYHELSGMIKLITESANSDAKKLQMITITTKQVNAKLNAAIAQFHASL